MRNTLLLLMLLLFTGGGIVHAQDVSVETRAQEVFSHVMSPYCPGLLLADCPSPDAFTLRAEVRRRIAAGENPADIEEALYRKFGDGIRSVPRPGGWGLVLWVVPLTVFALSFGALAWYLARVKHTSTIDQVPRLATDPALEGRLDDELLDL